MKTEPSKADAAEVAAIFRKLEPAEREVILACMRGLLTERRLMPAPAKIYQFARQAK
jgi:hypothetical protein